MTPQESALWARLRGRQAGGLKFRRQHPVGRFVLDFYCPAAKLAVEVDGSVHEQAERREADVNRSAWLSSLGLRVMRFTNSEIVLDLDQIVERIVEAARSPLSQGERGRG